MAYQFPPDVEELVRERMATAKYASQDELLREALLTLAEQDDDLQAVRDAIAEVQAGDVGIPLDEAFEALRRKQSPAMSPGTGVPQSRF